MTNNDLTAVEHIKTFAPRGLELLDLGRLNSFMGSKGFSIPLAARPGELGYFGPLFASLVLRNPNLDFATLNDYAQALPIIPAAPMSPYLGTDKENARIAAGIANSGISSGTTRYGEGSASFFSTTARIPEQLRQVPIAIIGAGAAGLIVSHALQRIGFEKLTVFEKSKKLGIWSLDNVARLSRNNPLRLQFFEEVLNPAPGGGDEVKTFLKNISTVEVKTATITKMEPGRLKHRIHFSNGQRKKFPIVINAIGLGKPKPVSDASRMETSTGESHAGSRWQMILDPDRIAGQRIILIGLGNSTAEMLAQIHTLIDRGYNLDYRVLTHYPEEAVQNPSRYIVAEGKMFRVFRDVSRPNLVDYQGDLAHSRHDYFRALHAGKIVSNVKRWEVERKGSMLVYRGGAPEEMVYDKIMTLIGYHQPKDTMTALGCKHDPNNGCGIFDYDGEVALKPGYEDPDLRLHKGCFGFGSILETPLDPNTIVIPGMLHHLGDLLFGVVMRAAEVQSRTLLR